MRARSLWAVVVAVVAAAGLQATPAQSAERYVDEVFTDVVTTSGIVYGQAVNSRGELQDLTLTLYSPAGDTEPFRPVFLYAPGGFFTNVDGCPTSYLDTMAKRGYVAACMRYRVRPELPNGLPGVLLPENLPATTEASHDVQHDMQAAVRWFRRHAVTHRVDAGRIAVAGHSAGGITAQGAAFNSEDPGDSGNPGYPSVVTAAVSHSGGWAVGLQGVIEPGSSPVAYFHAVDDTVVPFATAVAPCAATTAVGNICELTPFPSGGHRRQGDNLAREFVVRQVVRAPRTPTTVTIDRVGAALMATLKADDGSPLGGRRVVFTIGSQHVEATTGSDGVATFGVANGTPPAAEVVVTFSGEQTSAATRLAAGSGYAGSLAVYRPR